MPWYRSLLAPFFMLASACGGGPLHEPGAVRRGANLRAPLDPPRQDGGDTWRVEPDVSLHHFEQGTGRKALVLHGGPAIPVDAPWPGLSAVEGFSFQYYHQRGCGRSTRPFERFEGGSFFSNMKVLEQTLGLGAQVADVERIRRILGEERLVIVAHSFGALVAALYAAEFPERVAALVLEAPADLLVVPSETGGLFELVGARLDAAQRVEFQEYMGRYLDFRHLFDRTESELAALHAGFGKFYFAAMGGAGAGAGGAPPPSPVSSPVGGFMPQAVYLSMGRKHDWREAVAAVRAPVLVLHGEHDLQPLAATRAFAAAFPDAEVRVVPGVGHFGHADRPEAFAKEVREFLARRNVR